MKARANRLSVTGEESRVIISNERAIEIIGKQRMRPSVEEIEAAHAMAAAALSDCERLKFDLEDAIDVLQSIFEGYGLEGKARVEWEMYDGLAVLIKHNRVLRYGNGYRVSKQ